MMHIACIDVGQPRQPCAAAGVALIPACWSLLGLGHCYEQGPATRAGHLLGSTECTWGCVAGALLV